MLHLPFGRSARQYPDHVAVVDPGKGSISYRDLDAVSDRVRDRLRANGVEPGDRVGICLHKSIDTVATIYGILKLGAAYVPVDPGAPPARNAFILNNCAVKLAVIGTRFEDNLRAELGKLGAVPSLFVLGDTGGGTALRRALDDAQAARPAPAATTASPAPQDLAYILYTSGSTGKPKGVMLSHENAVSFVDWCSEVFAPQTSDRFSSHAPFHFDLSILDIHLPLKHGATLVLVTEDIGKDPVRLAPLIADQRITCWYSAPSILSLLAQYGKLAQLRLLGATSGPVRR